MSVRIPPTATKLREIMHCGQVIQSHALSFFYLSAPDLLLGFDSDPARRNVIGVIEDFPQLARDGIAMRRFGQQVIAGLAGERIHPSCSGRRQRSARNRRPGPYSGGPARGQGNRAPDTGLFQRCRRQIQ
jgi:hypothetical protein